MIYREWRIKVDWTRDIAARVDMPQFLQGDAEAIRLTVDMVNDRQIVDIMSTYRLMVLIVRPDGSAVVEQAAWVDENTAEYVLPGNALDIPGKCSVHLGLFGINGERLTHEKTLHYWVGADPGFCSDDAIAATTEYTILQQLIAEVGVLQTAAGLQYIWDGDRLGIKRSDEDEYTYSPSLTGPQGEPGELSETVNWSNVINKPMLLENFDQNSLSYLHIQNAASAIWLINHNLNKKEISVMIYDSTDRQVYGNIRLIDANNVELTFTGGFSGKAYVV